MEDPKKIAIVGAGDPNRQLAMYAAGAALSSGDRGTEAHKAFEAYAEGDAKLVAHMQTNTVCPQLPLIDGIPNHLSIDRASRYYSPCGAYIGIEIDGENVTGQVVEYNVREGWVRLSGEPSGTKLTYQQVLDAKKRYGVVEPFWVRQPGRQVRRQLAKVPQ